jgi:hypothetical protein
MCEQVGLSNPYGWLPLPLQYKGQDFSKVTTTSDINEISPATTDASLVHNYW